ncbi:MAG: TIGR02996 domain-containing protein [Gemmataceae bacterium]|nr:TIGR02996 domain-containing protein [Gemmata sp.]MDW8196633.1 TIGR02996 domain-containing protein [Gemmataceae bacterium]
MEPLAHHEAFLRAIYDHPDDDTPRLVYADFLHDQGDEPQAAFIRWQCGRGPQPPNLPRDLDNFHRGLPKPQSTVVLATEQLAQPQSLRWQLVRHQAGAFAAHAVQFTGRRITSAEPFDVFFDLVAFCRVTMVNLAGEEVVDTTQEAGLPFGMITHLKPVITTAGVMALAQHRGARRITALDLRNNDLDNDAARALVQSPYLDNLQNLQLLTGNRLRGQVWQLVVARFGEDVVE